MLGGCGNEGKLVTSQYLTTLQQMRVWICCIYECIARVESKGTHRFMNPQNRGWKRTGAGKEWKQKTDWTQNEHFKVNPVTTVYIVKANCCTSCCHDYPSLCFGRTFWGIISREPCFRCWSLVKRRWVGSFKKKLPCYLLFSKGFQSVFIKTTTLLWIQIYLLQSA